MKLIHFVGNCYVNAEDILMINYLVSPTTKRVYIFLKSHNVVGDVYTDVKDVEDAKNRIKYVVNQISLS